MNLKSFMCSDRNIAFVIHYMKFTLSRTKVKETTKRHFCLSLFSLQMDSNPEPLSYETNTQPFGQTGQMIELCSEYLSFL